MTKLSTLAEAVSTIPNGSHVSLSGFAITRCNMAFAAEVIRQGIKGLTVSQCVGAMDADLLAGAGALERIVYGGGSLDRFGRLNCVNRGIEGGTLCAEEYSSLSMAFRYLAGSLGLPFIPIRSLRGSDILRRLQETAPSEIASNTVLSLARPSRVWSTAAIFTVAPISIVPESGCSLPVMILISVDLPAPLGPRSTAISPSNFLLTNPELFRETMATNGENLARGMEMLAQDISAATGSLGVRSRYVERTIAPRNTVILETSFGPIPFKAANICSPCDSVSWLRPEYEAVAALARERGIEFVELYDQLVREQGRSTCNAPESL